jgi:hypothetical protein
MSFSSLATRPLKQRSRAVRLILATLLGSAFAVVPVGSQTASNPRQFLDTYCVTCHNQKLRAAGLELDRLDPVTPAANAEVWERVIGKLRSGSMPPPGLPRPDVASYHAVVSSLESKIDQAWAAAPNPGRSQAVHRLNRAEYQNAIHDLFALDFDARPLLPGDETADGSFDNFADVLSVSTAHLERYLSVARQVTRLATGLPPSSPSVQRFEIPLHVLQDDRQSEDLPLGSRGGIAIPYNFPVDGEYVIKVRLQRPAMASPASPAIPNGKNTCRSTETRGWRFA